MNNAETITLAQKLGERLLDKNWTITTAESCTGGGISSAITDVAGSSAWFEQAFITYSNEAKNRLLDVDPVLIERNGAVSKDVVMAMLMGALKKGSAELGVAVSGIAGPGGAVEGKPVGTVWLAWGSVERPYGRCFHFQGNRVEVRKQAVIQALELVLEWFTLVK